MRVVARSCSLSASLSVFSSRPVANATTRGASVRFSVK